MGRPAAVRAIVLASVLACLAGCSDIPGPGGTPQNSLGLILSAPVSGPLGAARVAGPAASSAVVSAGVVYVSLPPGSAPTGARATITDQATGLSATTVVAGGGFDPVPLGATVGDTVAVAIAGTPGATSIPVQLNVVPASRPPQLVRTSPASGAHDVPLNAALVVVFSDPIDSATLSPSSFGLLRGGTPVGGTVRSIGPSGVSAEFYPDSPLAPLTSYQLFVTRAIHDVNGVPLAAAVTLTFTTAGSVPTTGNLQIIISGLPVTGLAAVTVSGPGGFSQTVTTSQTLSNILAGTYTISALKVAVSSAIYGPAPASQTIPVTASTTPATATVNYAVLSGWTTMAPMPTARPALAVGVVNGVLYAVGGNGPPPLIGSLPPLANVEAFDPATNSWTTKAPMPTARTALAVGVVNGVLYAVGGSNGGLVVLGTLEAYDPVTNRWTNKAPMPTARVGLAVGVVGGVLYAVGGFNGTTTYATVEAYDPATDTWTTKAAMPTARNNLAAGVVNGVLYAVGGLDSLGFELATVEAYDPTTNTWTTKASMPTARQSFDAGVVNGLLYAVGGLKAGAPLATMEAYDPVTNSWTTKAPMLTARWGPAAGVVSGILYAVGGSGSAGVLSTVEAYIP